MIDSMKCVCGYESAREIFIEEKYVGMPKIDTLIGDEPFIRIETEYGFRISSGSHLWRADQEVGIFACPKCGTLKIKLNL